MFKLCTLVSSVKMRLDSRTELAQFSLASPLVLLTGARFNTTAVTAEWSSNVPSMQACVFSSVGLPAFNSVTAGTDLVQ